MRWLAILVLALALVAAGCGGSDDESAAGETTAESTTTTVTATDEATTDESATDGTSTDGTDLSAVLADEDCLALAGAGAAFAQAITAGSTSGDESKALEELASKVPDEIEADVQVLAEAYAKYAAELEDVGIEAGQTPSADQLQQLQAAVASVDQQSVNEASARLSAWAQKNCPGG